MIVHMNPTMLNRVQKYADKNGMELPEAVRDLIRIGLVGAAILEERPKDDAS